MGVIEPHLDIDVTRASVTAPTTSPPSIHQT